MIGLMTIGADSRVRIADWALAEFFENPMDFNIIIHILGGDEYYERNKRDIAKLHREVGCSIMEIFDTHPIFAKYPHLRGFARNKQFEIEWLAQKKQKER